jgi:hypothetical protein
MGPSRFGGGKTGRDQESTRTNPTKIKSPTHLKVRLQAPSN